MIIGIAGLNRQGNEVATKSGAHSGWGLSTVPPFTEMIIKIEWLTNNLNPYLCRR
jgi:hypothetical protein